MYDNFRPIDWYRRALGCALEDERRCLKAQVCREYTGPELDQRLAEIRVRIAGARDCIRQYEEEVRQEALKYDALFPGARERRTEMVQAFFKNHDWRFKYQPTAQGDENG
jgi:hypothetical protein